MAVDPPPPFAYTRQPIPAFLEFQSCNQALYNSSPTDANRMTHSYRPTQDVHLFFGNVELLHHNDGDYWERFIELKEIYVTELQICFFEDF